jgi:hypothetical protein
LVFVSFALSDSNGQPGLKIPGKVYCMVLHIGEGPGADFALFSGRQWSFERRLKLIFGMRASRRSSWWHPSEFTIMPDCLTISLRKVAGINSIHPCPVVYG